MDFKNLVRHRVVAENSHLVAEAMAYYRANPEGDVLVCFECDVNDMVEDRLDEATGAWVVGVAGSAEARWIDYWTYHSANVDWPF